MITGNSYKCRAISVHFPAPNISFPAVSCLPDLLQIFMAAPYFCDNFCFRVMLTGVTNITLKGHSRSLFLAHTTVQCQCPWSGVEEQGSDSGHTVTQGPRLCDLQHVTSNISLDISFQPADARSEGDD